MTGPAATHRFERDLPKREANYVPLSPVSFLARAVDCFADKLAIVDHDRRFTYRQFGERCARLAFALRRRGVGHLDTVAILAPNVTAMLEAHYAVPMLGAVLNPLNTRLDAASIARSLVHGEAKVLIADREFASTVRAALAEVGRPLLVIDIADPTGEHDTSIGEIEYEALLRDAEPAFPFEPPEDEWQSLCLLYTSGTTGNPKGAVYSHRGAYLAALSNALAFGLAPDSVYLWTLPMFHCDGWTYPWAVTAVGGTHVCLRRIEPHRVFELVERERVTHLCGAPIVLNMLVHAPAEEKRTLPTRVKVATGGAAPPSTVIASMEAMGFDVIHLYGATESYGPSTACVPQDGWQALGEDERHLRMARQGVRSPCVDGLVVADPETGRVVARDGETVGEMLLRGNTIMKGYLDNPTATAQAFEGGWYHSGDLAVWHADGYCEVKDRSKDIIISGGENISSLEIEEVLYKHPAIMEAAVVARPDERWGESPCAFVTVKPDAAAPSAEEVIEFCRANLARFKIPKSVVFGPLPKTNTGKIQKFVLREQATQLR